MPRLLEQGFYLRTLACIDGFEKAIANFFPL